VNEILIIEDTADDRRLLERTLRTLGVANQIRAVTTGAEALIYLNAKEKILQAGDQADIGVIFFDVRLPDISGLDLLRIVSQRKTFSKTLKVVISQLEDMENIKRAYTLGADSFIAKPPINLDIMELVRCFPENWILADHPLDKESQAPASDSSDGVVDSMAKNRELIETLRRNMNELRCLGDRNETLAIIETLTAELRIPSDTVNERSHKRESQ